VSSRRRRKETEGRESWPDWMTGEVGRQFVAVDIECGTCGRHLIRARRRTAPGMDDGPAWHQKIPVVEDAPGVGPVCILYCKTCSKSSGTIERRAVPQSTVEEALDELFAPGARSAVVIQN
jgi:hypothetical protein